MRVERLLCPIGTCPWTHDRETPPAETRTFPDGQSPLHDGPPKDLHEAIADVALATLLHDARQTESAIRAHLETHTLEDWVRETVRLRGLATRAPIQWLGEQNCEQVFALLRWEHPDDELDHSHIYGLGPGREETAVPGDWIIPDGDGWYQPAALVPRRLIEQLRVIAAYVSLGRRAVDRQPDGAPYPDAQARFALAELGDLIGRPEQTDASG